MLVIIYNCICMTILLVINYSLCLRRRKDTAVLAVVFFGRRWEVDYDKVCIARVIPYGLIQLDSCVHSL